MSQAANEPTLPTVTGFAARRLLRYCTNGKSLWRRCYDVLALQIMV